MSDHGNGEAELLRTIVARATADAAFRQRVLVDPATAIYDAFGVRVPAGYRIRFIEKASGLEALVTLADIPRDGDELDDDDLDAVAGGDGLCGETSTW
jgi:hypothetical protein